MDDIATGGSPSKVRQIAGELVDSSDLNNFETNGTLSQILSKGNLNLKAVVISGEDNPNVISVRVDLVASKSNREKVKVNKKILYNH